MQADSVFGDFFLTSAEPGDMNMSITNLSMEQIISFIQAEEEYLADNSRLHLLYERLVTLLYCLTIVLGVLTNLLLMGAFFTNKVLLTARNIFIVNLAISDLLLCSFTMPLTMLDIITKFWVQGPSMEFICKLAGSFQATFFFFSSFSILMIAMDRYRFILQPKHRQISIQMAIWLSLLSLLVSCLMSSPLFMMTELKVYTNLLSDGVTSFCYENWSHIHHHLAYTIICFLVQYLIPCISIGYIYCRVCRALPNIVTNAPRTNIRMIRKMARRKRANIILVGVSLIFFICWAPINVLNIFMNISTMFNFESPLDQHWLLITFSGCHLFAMTSVVFNPVLYGLTNKCIKKSLQSCVYTFSSQVATLSPRKRSLMSKIRSVVEKKVT